MIETSELLKKKLLGKGFNSGEIGLFVKDIIHMLQCRPDMSMNELGNRLTLLGWKQAGTDVAAIQMVRDHCER